MSNIFNTTFRRAMKIRLMELLLIILGFFTVTQAQTIHFLDLAGSLEIAMNRSFKMRSLREDLIQAELSLKATTHSLRTRAYLNLEIPNYTETIRRFEDSLGVYYSPIKQAYYNNNLVINQPLPSDGRIYLSSGFFLLEDLNKNKNSLQLSTRLGFEQPLEALYSYNRIKADLKKARLNYELTKKRLARTELDLRYEVSQAFYQLLAALEREKINHQTLLSQREAHSLAQNKFKAGVIAEVEAMQMEVDLGEALNDYDISVASRRAREDALKQLLGLALQDSVVLSSDMSYQPVVIDLDVAVQLGLQNRLEIREKEIQEELQGIEVRRMKINGQITGKLSAYYDFIGVSENERSTAFATTFQNSWAELQNRPGNRVISLSISIPIWDWGVNKANVNAALSALRKAQYATEDEKVTVERDIRETVTQVQSSLRRLELLEKNVLVAEKSFEISKRRFENGDINSQSLALDRNRLSQAHLSHLEAFISYKLLLEDLTRKTFYDFIKQEAL
jgi:outer membrane protein TolC